MKRFLTILTASVVLAASAFAADLYADVNFAVPFAFSTSNVNTDVNAKNYSHITTKTMEQGMGVDAGLTLMLEKTFGVRLDAGYYVPNSASMTVTTETAILGKVTTSENKGKQSISDVTSLNLFFGPCLLLDSSKTASFYLTPGLSLDKRTTSVTVNGTTSESSFTKWGFGAELQYAYGLSKTARLNFACPVIYNFKAVTENNETELKELYIVPKIGIGFKF